MKPAYIQLSRRKGFDLQAASLALNGLPAVNWCKHGKPCHVQDVLIDIVNQLPTPNHYPETPANAAARPAVRRAQPLRLHKTGATHASLRRKGAFASAKIYCD